MCQRSSTLVIVTICRWEVLIFHYCYVFFAPALEKRHWLYSNIYIPQAPLFFERYIHSFSSTAAFECVSCVYIPFMSYLELSMSSRCYSMSTMPYTLLEERLEERLVVR